MAVCPFAVKRLIAPGSSDPRIEPRVAILHVDAGNASSLYDYFKNRSGGIESHFHIRKDGVIEQYRDTAFQADANLHANDFAVSIETQGFGEGEWPPAQLASIKRLLLWLNKVHGIPLEQCPAPYGKGVGYHTLFGAPSAWTPVAKSCPGPDRKKQFHSILVPWMAEVTKGKTLRVATYNVGHKRNKQRVKGEVIRLSRSCDVILLQEAQDYTKGLRSIPGFRLKGRGENPILVRDGLEVSKTRRRQVTSKVWKTARGKQTKPEFATFTTVEGVRFSSWHFPPSVQSRLQRLRMPRRFAAYREMADNFKLGRYRAVAGGDFNVHAPTDNGRVKAFPQAFIARRNAKAVFPDKPTHGKRIIDGFAARGVEVSDVTVLNGYGSDHRPVRMVITYKDR